MKNNNTIKKICNVVVINVKRIDALWDAVNILRSIVMPDRADMELDARPQGPDIDEAMYSKRPNKAFPMELYCPECLGTDILMDSLSSWNVESQLYDTENVFEAGYCQNEQCDRFHSDHIHHVPWRYVHPRYPWRKRNVGSKEWYKIDIDKDNKPYKKVNKRWQHEYEQSLKTMQSVANNYFTDDSIIPKINNIDKESDNESTKDTYPDNNTS